jgi:hypothetical protein
MTLYFPACSLAFLLLIAPSQGGDQVIEPGKPFVSRYRLIAFDGVPAPKRIEARWREYGR